MCMWKWLFLSGVISITVIVTCAYTAAIMYLNNSLSASIYTQKILESTSNINIIVRANRIPDEKNKDNKKVNNLISEVKELTERDLLQKERFAKLDDLYSKVVEFEKSSHLREIRPMPDVYVKFFDKLDEIENYEKHLLSSKQLNLERNITYIIYSCLLSVLLECIVMAILFITIMIQNSKLQKYQAFFRLSADMMCIAKGVKFLEVNQSFENVLGYTKEEMIKASYFEFIHPEDRELTQNELIKLENSYKTKNFENRYVDKNGKYHWFNWTAVTEGGLNYAIARDVTEDKEKENTIKVINQELTQFTYVVSHDLKSPLRALSNLARWLYEDFGDTASPEAKEWLILMQERAARMNKLIDGLLDYSRVGRKNIELESVDVNEVINQVLDSLEKKEFTIDVAKMPTITANHVMIEQVFVNLISNAIKHHPRSNGKIEITVKETSYYHEFTVSDDGDGVPIELQNKLFILFQTLKPKEGDSTGIGLAICKKIIESNGGKIWIESSAGNGCKFIFIWPKKINLEKKNEAV